MVTLSYQITQTFEVETCVNCGVQFAMSTEFKAERLKNRGPNNPFYCPNGHKQHYVGKSAADKERERADDLQRQLEAAEARSKRQRELREAAER